MFEKGEIISLGKINIKKIDIWYWVIFSFIGLITFSSLIIFELSNPDAIWNNLYYKEGWRWEAQLGRYMIRFFQLIFGNVINSPSFTILGILLLALICVIVNKIFELDGIMAILGGAILMLSPAIVSTLTYYYCSLYYIIAYLLAVITSWIICKCKNWLVAFVGMGILCISMAIYQAYIGIILILGLLYVTFLLLDKNQDLKNIFNRVLYMLVVIAGGIIVYLVTNKFYQKMLDIAPVSDRGFSEMGNIPLENLSTLLKNCYVYTYQYFFSKEMINNDYGFKKVLHFIFFLLLIFVLVREVVKSEKKWYYRILFLISVSLVPLGLMSITIAGSGVSIYDTTGVIMLPTMNYVYVLLIILLHRLQKVGNALPSYLKWCGSAIILLIVISMFNICISAQSYQKHMMNKMDYLSKSIVNDIERLVDHSDEYTICFVGEFENGNYPELYPELKESISWLTASHGTVWKTFLGTQECWRMYIKQYTGKEYRRCQEEEYKEIIKSNFFNSMNNYPDTNSIAVYNENVIVIRLSDVKN